MSPQESQFSVQITELLNQLGISETELILKTTRELNKFLKVSVQFVLSALGFLPPDLLTFTELFRCKFPSKFVCDFSNKCPVVLIEGNSPDLEMPDVLFPVEGPQQRLHQTNQTTAKDHEEQGIRCCLQVRDVK